MSKIVYASNKKQVGDGMRITRVSGNGTVFEIWTGTTFSPVELEADQTNSAPTGGNITLNYEVGA